MWRGDDDASAILRRVPSGRQQPPDALAAAPTVAVGGQRQGWDEDQEDETRSEVGNENFKARAQRSSCDGPARVMRAPCCMYLLLTALRQQMPRCQGEQEQGMLGDLPNVQNGMMNLAVV